MRKILIGVFAILSLIFTACDDSSSINSNMLSKKKIEESQKEFEPQSFLLLTTNEKLISFKTTKEGVDFDEFKSKKAVIIDIFATWCPPCIESIPNLKEIKDRYKDKLEIVSVLFQDEKSVEEMNEFIKEYNINYPITMGDENQRLADELGVSKVPEMFLFSKSGKFVHRFVGKVSKDELEKYLKIAIEN